MDTTPTGRAPATLPAFVKTNGKLFGCYVAHGERTDLDGRRYVVVSFNERGYSVGEITTTLAVALQRDGVRYEPQTIRERRARDRYVRHGSL